MKLTVLSYEKGMSFSDSAPLLMKIHIFEDVFSKWKLDDVLNFRKAHYCFGQLPKSSLGSWQQFQGNNADSDFLVCYF